MDRQYARLMKGTKRLEKTIGSEANEKAPLRRKLNLIGIFIAIACLIAHMMLSVLLSSSQDEIRLAVDAMFDLTAPVVCLCLGLKILKRWFSRLRRVPLVFYLSLWMVVVTALIAICYGLT